jgi:hypothetical protein
VKKAEEGIRRTERETERECLRFQRERAIAQVYVNWLKQVDWKFFCTFAFAWKVSDQQAEKTFAAFIDRLARTLRCEVCYFRGDEKRVSGCGKPASGRHFHALLACVAPVNASFIEFFWKSMAGNRSDDAGAQVEEYNSSENGARYILKNINQPDGNWAFRNLELFHPEARASQTVNARWRRKQRRFEERQREFAH